MPYLDQAFAKVYHLSLLTRSEATAAALRRVLRSFGVDDVKISEERKNEVIGLSLFDASGARLRLIHDFLKKLKLNKVRVSFKVLSHKDWLTRWKRDWKPSRLTKKLDVVPQWCRDTYRPRGGRDHIILDTVLSFGSGLHETTRFVAQFIEDASPDFRSFLDIGTGTGILSLVALKCGAHNVMAMDIEPLSIEAARQNMKANKVSFAVQEADISKWKHARVYDLVAANLVTHDLIAHCPKILRLVKPGGLLAVSGISLERLAELRRSFARHPLVCLKVQKGEKWSGLLYQKKK